MPSKSNSASHKRFVRLKVEELLRFVGSSADESRESVLLRQAYVLFLRLYELHLDNRFMSKSQAARFTTVKHPASAQKILDDAADLGYLAFERDEVDTRRSLIKPTGKLIAFAESEVDRSIAAIREAVNQADVSSSPRKRR